MGITRIGRQCLVLTGNHEANRIRCHKVGGCQLVTGKAVTDLAIDFLDEGGQ